MPEFVQANDVNGVRTWTAAKIGEDRKGFYYRARIEIELVVDGNIIDLNRISLPADTPLSISVTRPRIQSRRESYCSRRTLLAMAHDVQSSIRCGL